MKSLAIVLVLLFACSVFAQQVPDAPSAQKAKNGSAQASDPERRPAAQGRASDGGGLETRKAPRERRISEGTAVADRSFWLMTGAMTATTVTNVELTSRCMAVNNCYNDVSPVNTRRGLYAIALPANAGMTLLTYQLKKSHKYWWWVPAAFVVGGNSAMLLRSAARQK